MALTISPALMPPKKRIPSLKELRGFALGERNPAKAPDPNHAKSESEQEYRERNAHWDRVRRLVESGQLTGAKY